MVSSQMLSILENYKKNIFHRPNSKKKRAALSALRVGKMKRKRKETVKKVIGAKLASVTIPARKTDSLFKSHYKIKRTRPND